MQGWPTVDVYPAIDIIQQHGKFKVLGGCDLVVETPNPAELEVLSQKLAEAFGKEAWLEPIAKTLLA